MTNVEVRIRGCYDSLSEAERKAADYYLQHTDQIFGLPVAQLAAKSGVSSTAWIRLCKSIGYAGLKDMRNHLYAERGGEGHTDRPDIHFADLQEGGSVADILHNVASASVQAIQDTARLLDLEALGAAAECILRADAVGIFGIGASALVAEDLYDKLIRIRKNARFSQDSHIQLAYSVTLTKRDAAVFLSNSGSTQEILQAMEAAKEAGCATIAVTRYRKSPLAAGCDLCLHISSPEVYVRSGAMSSRIAQLTAVDALFTVIASRDYPAIQDSLEKSYQICLTHRVSP